MNALLKMVAANITARIPKDHFGIYKNKYNIIYIFSIKIFDILFSVHLKSYFGNHFAGAYVKPDTNNI